MLGSSHGGYLAHLCAKIAPWNINAVIDNSSYARFLWRLIGFGKELDYTLYPSFSTNELFKHISIFGFDNTFFTTNKHSPYFFSSSHQEIRYILNEKHLKVQSAYPKPCYISYHSYYDTQIAPPNEKEELYALLQKLGFKAKLYMIKDESEVDGSFIKNLSHSMGMSIKTLINKELPKLLQKLKIHHYQGKKEIIYETSELLYLFKEKKGKIQLICHKK